MTLREFHEAEDAVSPVIGVVLMVAVTVVLAAVIATFVFGLGEGINDSVPQAAFSTKFTGDPAGAEDSWGHEFGKDFDHDGTNETAALDITFTAGQGIDASTLSVRYPGGSNEFAGTGSQPYNGTAKLGAGDGVTLAVEPGDTVRVVWTAPDGSRSATLLVREVPS